jgi:YesN/AraC family two-component response regulator
VVRPLLLWVDRCIVGAAEQPPAAFEQYCDIRVTAGEIPPVAETSSRPQIICFNFDFPDMFGLRLLADTKKHYASIPVLMLTLQHSEELAVWAFRSRVFDYLLKPVTVAEIDRCMSNLLDILKIRDRQQRRLAKVRSTPLPRESRYRAVAPATAQLQSALAHISAHFSQPIPESKAAALCGMSPYRFSRTFKSTFGVTFQNYLIDYRISRAKHLLANPGMSIIDIGLSVGFNDPSYFSRAFKRRTGMSPSRYRDSCNAVSASTEKGLSLLRVVSSESAGR